MFLSGGSWILYSDFALAFSGSPYPSFRVRPGGFLSPAGPHDQNHKCRDTSWGPLGKWPGGRDITGPPIFLRWQQMIWTKGSGSMGGSIPHQVSVVAAKVEFSKGSFVLRCSPDGAKRLLGRKASQGCTQ
uniref:Uncharacterized protein n=1 Tax=Myotis myotis TaxID=51298 RepID=A0A7J8AM68_MYOMY|nr:hypothetical protein mMyoMyo1_008104 [Myotis myotis]